MAIEVVDTDQTTDENSLQTDNTGWETTPVVCKRHSYKGGNICLRCNTPKPVREVSTRVASTDATPTTRGGSKNEKVLRSAISFAWFGVGMTIENLPNRFPKLEPISPVGKVLQFESAVAGQRISTALKKTPAWRPIMALMSHVGPWADLAPLVLPPVLVGMMSLRPSLRNNPTLNSMLIAALVPLMSETAALAQEQAEMISQMSQFNDESVGAAMNMLSNIFGDKESDSSD